MLYYNTVCEATLLEYYRLYERSLLQRLGLAAGEDERLSLSVSLCMYV